MVSILLKERERHLRICAGVPDDIDVNLGLARLPDGALIFPVIPVPGAEFSFTTPRNPRNFSKEFARRAKRLGLAGFTFHHLRGTHATLLLDRGVPVHIVAERIGDDPAVLLRSYAKRKRKTTATIRFPPTSTRWLLDFSENEPVGSQLGPCSHCVRNRPTLSD